MPIYSYRCDTCETEFDRMLPMSQHADPQECEECGNTARKIIVPVNFNLPGDDWASKNGRIQKQMRERRDRLAGKEREMKREAPGVRLAPNVEGERVGSWAEAQRLAASKGKDTASYEPLVRKENEAKK